jgi:V/A-type H+-transporting ATPase subunit E
VGWPELIHVLEEEAAREARLVRESAAAEAERILAQARAAAQAAHEALLAREADEDARSRRAAEAASGLEGDRLLLEARRALGAELRAAVARRLEAVEVDEAVLLRLVGELCAEAPDGPFTLVVDPGDEARVQAILAADHAGLLPRVTIEAAPRRRGGVELTAGRLWLDDTLASRLERAWPALEGPLLQALVGAA